MAETTCVYAAGDVWLSYGPNGTFVRKGEKFAADDPIVKAHPLAFQADDPREVRSAPRVEQATAAPGERRQVRRPASA